MSQCILLTGATGALGTQIAGALLRETNATVVALVRGGCGEAATRHLRRAWWDWPELAALIGTRVEVVAGDVSLPRLGLSPDVHDALVARISHVVHAAADLRLHAPIEELRRTNVQGTANVLDLARAAHRHHGIERLAHISTAYVCGSRQGDVPEEELSEAFGFASAYERSKYEGERLARAAGSELPVSIFRPGMIVGDSESGTIKTFNTVYVPLRLYLQGKLPVVPVRRDQRLNVVPIDYVAGAVVRLTLAPEAAGRTFHLTAAPAAQPTAGELVEGVRAWAATRLGRKPLPPLFVTVPDRLRPLLRGRLARAKRGSTLAALAALWPYIDDRRAFLRANTDRLLGPYDLDWRAALPRQLDFAESKSFLHRSERTVHEQILFRLQSTTRPVTCYDVVEGVARRRASAGLRQDILTATAALRALGVQAGDRVGIVGLNSTRYLTLDAAIGLLGAISVPLYYTSPPDEIAALLRASGARLLLVGAPGLLGKLGNLDGTLQVASFCRELPPDGLPREVIDWEALLTVGARSQAVLDGRIVCPDDPATVRYTSGTTGQPKGVVFTQRQLRWMAETIAALMPWRVRTGGATYLSFLPMNHVVEGILGTYAPYYLPFAVSIYFLDDLHDLPRALPRVRPTVFFSVPRVYEKVWNGLRSSAIGRSYLGARGPWKRLLRPVIRWSVLRRAGFDRCAWLIVGSAPVDQALLRSFHELGIEVHNAYGLTEAPLVTINRPGANRLGTSGQPLPATELRLDDDGEILVRGPQVTSGYFAPNLASPLRDGWLLTGDLGRITPRGDLVIEGRKKELIATSYGKKIQIAKVESLLRAIPGVAEAMVVGEARPYCVALLWADEAGLAAASAIDGAVIAANGRLSHPEQVKRWAILKNELSIERGDLTANLKLKRQAVAQRYHDVIEALYHEDLVVDRALHVEGAPREERVPV